MDRKEKYKNALDLISLARVYLDIQDWEIIRKLLEAEEMLQGRIDEGKGMETNGM